MPDAIREILRSPWNRVGIAFVAAVVILVLVFVAMDHLG